MVFSCLLLGGGCLWKIAVACCRQILLPPQKSITAAGLSVFLSRSGSQSPDDIFPY